MKCGYVRKEVLTSKKIQDPPRSSSYLQGILVVRETEIHAHCPCFQVFITKFREKLVCRDTAVENHCVRQISLHLCLTDTICR